MTPPPKLTIKFRGIYSDILLSPKAARQLMKKWGSTLDVAALCRVPEHVIYNALPTEKAPYADTL